MWHNNRMVNRTYTSHHAQNCWAVISGIAGWKKVRPNAPDGVTNVFMVLSGARANGRPVDVYIVGDQIERATLK
jgi:hypothetical protein